MAIGKSKLETIAEIWAFMRVRKKFWLAPILILLLILGVLIVFAESSPLAPFVYSFF